MKAASWLITIITFVNLIFTALGYINYITIGINTFCMGWTLNNIFRSYIHD